MLTIIWKITTFNLNLNVKWKNCNIYFKNKLPNNFTCFSCSVIVTTTDRIKSKKYQYKVFIDNKDNNNEVKIFYNNKIFYSKIEKSIIKIYPNDSKIIHLENGFFICGGIDKNENAIDNCYIVKLEFIQDKFIQSIVEFTKMNEKRNWHNAIYLENINYNLHNLMIIMNYLIHL